MENISDKILKIRSEYGDKALVKEDLNPDPIKQFESWLENAIEIEASEPNAMAISTVDSQNNPRSRYVLFKNIVNDSLVFHSHYESAKAKEIENRRASRREAYEKYDELIQNCGENITEEQKNELQDLKRKMTKITREDIETVQNLFDAYGIKYITAKGEADVLCASLVIKKKVYAVLTEDMDLFAYTCPFVLRYFSLSNHTVILYDLKKILTKLDIDKKNFQVL